jgi:hypothetical protein
MAKSTRELRQMSTTEVDTLMLRVHAGQLLHPATITVEVNEDGKWKPLGNVTMEPGDRWVKVDIDWNDENLAVWEKNLVIQSLVQRHPYNFKIKEESDDRV